MYTNAERLITDLNELLNEFGNDFSELSFLERVYDNGIGFDVSYLGESRSYDYEYVYSSELERKRYEKRYAKLSLYRALCDILHTSLPWGALTGIRPTKLARTQGDGWKNFFLNTMLVSERKTKIVADVLAAQSPYVNIDDDITDLFVSIPLCPTRCAYCSFISCEIDKEKHVNEYIEALVKEIECARSLGKAFRSVYVGGGTPVALTDEHFEAILSAIGKQTVEYTIEAGRPDRITESKLDIMKRYGVTRVCVNPQTFSDKTLGLIGRAHTVAETFEKYSLVRSYGFDINVDLIAALPEETFEDFSRSVDIAVSLDPENITVHTLCLKSGSKLKEQTDRLPKGAVAEMIDYSSETLVKAGYRPYYLYRQKYAADNLENTGYSKKGKECVYNIDVMEEYASVVACGANAISKRVKNRGSDVIRLAAPKNIEAYLGRVEEIVNKKFDLFK